MPHTLGYSVFKRMNCLRQLSLLLKIADPTGCWNEPLHRNKTSMMIKVETSSALALHCTCACYLYSRLKGPPSLVTEHDRELMGVAGPPVSRLSKRVVSLGRNRSSIGWQVRENRGLMAANNGIQRAGHGIHPLPLERRGLRQPSHHTAHAHHCHQLEIPTTSTLAEQVDSQK